MKIHDCQQGSDAWYSLRASRPTASEFGSFIKLNGDPRDSEMRRTYLATKVAEAWLGGPLPGFQTWDTEQGKLLEEKAIPRYELDYREEVKRVGFITNDAGTVGCSPDGLLPGCGLEIKCLQPTHHTKCLLAGTLPNCFKAQVHGSLYVTGLPEWKLFLYSRQFPPALFVVKRDERMMGKIHKAVTGFLELFDLSIAALTKMNGGIRPPTPKNPNPERIRMSWEEQPADIIP